MNETENTKKKTGGKSIAGEGVNSSTFPSDLIVETLSRLPVKSLLRFKTVCKPWCSLIRNPNFINLHFDRSTDNKCLFVEHLRDESLSIYSLNAEREDDPTTFLLKHDLPPKRATAYCNGLLCYFNWLDTAIPQNLWVCNLSTKQQIKLPPAPCVYFINLGLGFNPSTNDYSVVVISERSEWLLFTLGTTSWKKITSRPEKPCEAYFGGTLCLNGVLHWNSVSSNIITLFDLKTEEFGVLSYPTNFKKSILSTMSKMSGMCEVQGTLCLFYRDDFCEDFKLWVLKDYDNHSWDYRRFSLPRPFIFEKIIIDRNWDIATISSTSENDHHRYYLHSYNLHTCVEKKIELIGIPSNSDKVSIDDYKENMMTVTTG